MDEKEQAPNQEEIRMNEHEQKPTPTDEFEQAATLKRTHYTKTEIETLQDLINEGYSTREIAIKMNRTVSGIRNLRHRLDLPHKIQGEITALTKQRDALTNEIHELRIDLSLKVSRLEALKQETANYEALKKECSELEKAVEFYHLHGDQIRGEIQAYVRDQADLVAIQKIFELLNP